MATSFPCRLCGKGVKLARNFNYFTSKPLEACQLLRNVGNPPEKTKASVLCQDLSYLLDQVWA